MLTVPPTATTCGLLLRPWAERDIPAMIEAHRDPELRRWLRRPITTADEARRTVEERRAAWRAGTSFGFAVLVADSAGAARNLAGGVVIRGLDGGTGEARAAGAAGAAGAAAVGEVGYWVGSAVRGRGIAPRALNAACEWVFGLARSRPLEQLELIHAVGNQASCRVAAKAGFSLSAVIPPQPPDFPDHGHLHIRPAPVIDGAGKY